MKNVNMALSNNSQLLRQAISAYHSNNTRHNNTRHNSTRPHNMRRNHISRYNARPRAPPPVPSQLYTMLPPSRYPPLPHGPPPLPHGPPTLNTKKKEFFKDINNAVSAYYVQRGMKKNNPNTFRSWADGLPKSWGIMAKDLYKKGNIAEARKFLKEVRKTNAHN